MNKALILTAGEGHKSISTAVSQILEQNNWQTKTKNYINQKKITKTAFNIYRSIYKYIPQLNKLPYKTGRNTLLQKQINKFLEDYFSKERNKRNRRFPTSSRHYCSFCLQPRRLRLCFRKNKNNQYHSQSLDYPPFGNPAGNAKLRL